MDIDTSEVKGHTKAALRDAVLITCTMIAALMAAEGRVPDGWKIAKFLMVFIPLVVFLKINQNDIAKQILTASAIATGSKLIETITK